MNTPLSGPLTVNYKKDDIVCVANENDYDLFLIHKGKLLIFGNDGSRITPIAFLEAGEYFGELSFFDHSPRSANAVCVEDSTLIKIPVEEMEKQCPKWLHTMAEFMVKQLREATSLLAEKGIRKKNVETMKALSIDEQRHYYQLLQSHTEN